MHNYSEYFRARCPSLEEGRSLRLLGALRMMLMMLSWRCFDVVLLLVDKSITSHIHYMGTRWHNASPRSQHYTDPGNYEPAVACPT